jgi:hypothetical protein
MDVIVRAFAGLVSIVLLVACGSSPPAASDAKYPPRPEGCEVKIYPEAPPPGEATENIGPVTATCAENVTNEDCLRTLKDQACKLGGDVVWGVDPNPSNVAGKKRFAGRAAHTKAPGSSASPK